MILTHPLISIIIPTYNRKHLLSDTLNSISEQTYTNWECIIVDDGSTDTTEALLNSYIKKDKRFQFHKRPKHKPKGANACRNYGFELSKGGFINWFDSDDVMEPNKLELQIRVLNDNEKAPYCICQTKWINKADNTFLGLRGKHISSNNRFEDYILYQIFWSILAPLWRRSFIVENNLIFDDSLHQSQEYDFHIKALAINSNYIAINDALVSMYKHETNLSNNIYEDDLKIKSNLRVKDKIIKEHIHKLSPKGVLKLLEILTLMYKVLLKTNKMKLAFIVIFKLLKILKHVEVSLFKKVVFCNKVILAYLSYLIFSRGYNIIKPLT